MEVTELSAIKRRRQKPKAVVNRVLRFRLHLTVEERERCTALRQEAARVWNRCIELQKEARQQGKWLGEGELKALTKGGQFALHAASVQAVVELYVECVERTREMRKAGHRIRYPYREKEHMTVTWKAHAIHPRRDGNVELSCGKGREPLVLRLPDDVPWCQVRQAQLVHRHGDFWLHLSVAEPAPAKQEGSGRAAGADPGEVHALALSTGDRHLVIVGRRLRSEWRLYHITLRRFQKKMARCKKNSRRWARLAAAKAWALGKIRRRIEHLECCIARHAVAWCLQQGVTTLYLGNPVGVEKAARGRRHRQRIACWRRGKLRDRTVALAARYGIRVEPVPERDTSQTCPVCGVRQKPQGRWLLCPAGHWGHRDVVGAVNILALGQYRELIPGRSMPREEDTTYLRPDRHKAVLAA